MEIIVTNPPFGGEEEKGIMSNFPEATRTSETALLFLQYIMRRLKTGGRCGMVVPNGTLSERGIATRIRSELVEGFNLHTIVRLPRGVFAPYTDIETNLLFFEKNGPTKVIWYFEHPLPLERRKMKNPCYTRSNSLQYEEFKPLTEWWDHRQESEYSWKVSVEEVAKNDYDLDIKNPNGRKAEQGEAPEVLAELLLENQRQIAGIVAELKKIVEKREEKSTVPMKPLSEVLTQNVEYIEMPEQKKYKKFSVKLYGKGVALDSPVDGANLKMKKHQIAKAGQVILSEIWGKKGAVGFVPPDGDGALCTSHFFLFDVRLDDIPWIPTNDSYGQLSSTTTGETSQRYYRICSCKTSASSVGRNSLASAGRAGAYCK